MRDRERVPLLVVAVSSNVLDAPLGTKVDCVVIIVTCEEPMHRRPCYHGRIVFIGFQTLQIKEQVEGLTCAQFWRGEMK